MGVLLKAHSVNSFAAMKSLLVISCMLLFVSLYPQKKYTINVPTSQYNSVSASADLSSIEDLVNEIGKYANLYASINCLEKLNPLIGDALQKEMSRITGESPYILTVDYNSCEFHSLLPDKGTGGIFSPSSTVYYIKLYPKIATEPVIKTEPVVKRDPASSGKKPLLATYRDGNGSWIAMGPYMTSDPYATEQQAIGSLFYGENDLRFICERGNYKIYSLNETMKYDGRDIRSALKQLGVDNIPEN